MDLRSSITERCGDPRLEGVGRLVAREDGPGLVRIEMQWLEMPDPDRLAAVALWATDFEAALGKKVELDRPWPFVRPPDYFLMPANAIVVELASGAREATSAES